MNIYININIHIKYRISQISSLILTTKVFPVRMYVCRILIHSHESAQFFESTLKVNLILFVKMLLHACSSNFGCEESCVEKYLGLA